MRFYLPLTKQILINYKLLFLEICFFILLSHLEANNYEKINSLILKSLPSNAQVGIIVKSINDEKLIFEHQMDQLFLPGSTVKILTAAIALKNLGPNFTYITELLAKKNLKENSCTLYVKFSGDPSFTLEDLTDLFNSLTLNNTHEIDRIIYDSSGYNVPPLNSSWMLQDIETCEVVPTTKAIINENYYLFELYPAQKLEERSTLKSKLGILPIYKIDNQVVTVPDENFVRRSYGFDGDILRIKGKTGIHLQPQRIELPISDLDFYIEQMITSALNNNNITITNKISSGKIPKDAVTVAKHKSKTMASILSQALKHSYNIPFGALLLEIASSHNPSITSWKDASNILKKAFYNHYSIDLSHAIIDDGIGVSRYNLISPRQMCDILLAVYKDPSISKSFLDALAQNGQEGKLQKRMTDPVLIGKIRAKTGILSGVTGLAGYLKTNDDNLVAFVIFVNNFIGSPQPFWDFQDKICRILIEEL